MNNRPARAKYEKDVVLSTSMEAKVCKGETYYIPKELQNFTTKDLLATVIGVYPHIVVLQTAMGQKVTVPKHDFILGTVKKAQTEASLLAREEEDIINSLGGMYDL